MKRSEKQRKTKMKTTRSGKIKRNPKRIAQTKKMKATMKSRKTQKILDRRTPSWRHMSSNKLRRKQGCSQCSTRTRSVRCKQAIKSLKIRSREAKATKVRQASTYKISAPLASNSTNRTSSIS